MPRSHSFQQVDVFAGSAYGGNPVAVVLDADGIDDAAMQRFANWTNLSETTFVLPPTQAGADYRVRIFTPGSELPFAGHPTLGTCHAWLQHGGRPATPGRVVQECGIGLVSIDTSGGELAFEAPPLLRSGPVDGADLAAAIDDLGIRPTDVLAAQWVDNGPGWLGLLLTDADTVLAVRPGQLRGPFIGIVGMHPAGSEFAYEVRGFFTAGGATLEDPITGSLNASLAQWLLAEGRVTAPYLARQGTVLGRSGVVSIRRSDDGGVWVGGATTTRLSGHAQFDG